MVCVSAGGCRDLGMWFRMLKKINKLFSLRNRKKRCGLSGNPAAPPMNPIQNMLDIGPDQVLTILDTLPGFVSIHSPVSHKVFYANSRFIEDIGDPTGKTCHELHAGSAVPCEDCKSKHVLDNGRPQYWEAQYPNGRFYRVWGIPFHMNGRQELILRLGVDITEQKEYEKQIMQYQQRLRLMTSEIAQIEERERKIFAHELHENIGQVLAGAKLELHRVQQFPGKASENSLKIVNNYLEQAINGIREVSYSLSPIILYNFGLESAIEQLTQEAEEKFGYSCTFTHDNSARHLPPDISIFIFRAINDLLLNVYKPGNPRNVAIKSEQIQDEICITLTGRDGRASLSDVRKSRTGEMCLFSIQEKIELIGGNLEVKSGINDNIFVKICMPFGQMTGKTEI